MALVDRLAVGGFCLGGRGLAHGESLGEPLGAKGEGSPQVEHLAEGAKAWEQCAVRRVTGDGSERERRVGMRGEVKRTGREAARASPSPSSPRARGAWTRNPRT